MTDPRDWSAALPPEPDPADRPLPPHLDPRGRTALPPRGGARHVVPAKPRRRMARVLSWVAVITSIAVLAVAGTGYA